MNNAEIQETREFELRTRQIRVLRLAEEMCGDAPAACRELHIPLSVYNRWIRTDSWFRDRLEDSLDTHTYFTAKTKLREHVEDGFFPAIKEAIRIKERKEELILKYNMEDAQEAEVITDKLPELATAESVKDVMQAVESRISQKQQELLELTKLQQERTKKILSLQSDEVPMGASVTKDAEEDAYEPSIFLSEGENAKT